jgi:glycosyltransferase involved in cell wall biosynthesis
MARQGHRYLGDGKGYGQLTGLSIIIPALNEADALPETLAAARVGCPGAEIIVVDGGSSDTTTTVARVAGALVLNSERGRGKQQNAGAFVATGDILLFLHADTLLPPGAGTAIETALQDSTNIGGNFRLAFRPASFLNTVFATVYNYRSRTARHFYGDSTLFIRRGVFREMEGFREGMLMEDWEFVLRLQSRFRERQERTICLPMTVATSARRFSGHRRWRYVALWGYLHYLYWRGVPGDKLAKLYPDVR